ncbi:MAG TPA: signal peptidase I, partial [Candidatus Lustribacter sp.]|nr:signal peptidase I [Candidatus Lustribacter sp.]
ALAVTVLVLALVRAFVVNPFVLTSTSMQPSFQPGDRVLVARWQHGGPLRRGDVVVFDGAAAFGGGTDGDYVKRVVAVGGDRVRCCTQEGRLSVNGVAVAEPYLFPGEPASASPFDILVPAGRVFVLGDHRGESEDSRAHLGGPGGGTVAATDVIGQVWVRYWPLDRLGGPGG